MIDGLLKEYNLGKGEQFISALDNYTLKELVDIYLIYARPKYFKEHKNMGEILNYISSYMLKKVMEVSFIETMDIYAKLLENIVDIERLIKNNENIVNIRNYNLKDEFFIHNESKTFEIEEDKFLKEYTMGLNRAKENVILYKTIFDILDKFQKQYFSYLDEYVESMNYNEKLVALNDINKKIEANSLEITKRIELKHNKKLAEIKTQELPLDKIIDMFNTTKLDYQNYVYSNYQEVLKENLKNNKNI